MSGENIASMAWHDMGYGDSPPETCIHTHTLTFHILCVYIYIYIYSVTISQVHILDLMFAEAHMH